MDLYIYMMIDVIMNHGRVYIGFYIHTYVTCVYIYVLHIDSARIHLFVHGLRQLLHLRT